MSSPIPIRNIYFLLCYAWNRLEEGNVTDVSGVDSAELADLFATVLISGVRHLLRRGLGRDYERFEEDLASLRGRVLVGESGRRMMMVHGKARCEFDELTINTWPNRVIKATMRHLSGVPSLDKELRAQLLGLCRELPSVDPVPLTRLAFRSIQLHSNARFYRFLISVCELVVSSWLVDERTGIYRFRDFLRDDKVFLRPVHPNSKRFRHLTFQAFDQCSCLFIRANGFVLQVRIKLFLCLSYDSGTWFFKNGCLRKQTSGNQAVGFSIGYRVEVGQPTLVQNSQIIKPFG